ncbi:hypothetical protein Plhal703r1_c26g0107301 [Plasmopara halstedii]
MASLSDRKDTFTFGFSASQYHNKMFESPQIERVWMADFVILILLTIRMALIGSSEEVTDRMFRSDGLASIILDITNTVSLYREPLV